MMPQPQADYLAIALAYRIIQETKLAQRGILDAIHQKEYMIAERFQRQWEKEVFKACQEMNQAAASTIQKQHETIMDLYNRMGII